MNETTCAFTGHRPQNLPFGFQESDPRCQALKAMLRRKIIAFIEQKNTLYFISGMALGIDLYAAEIVLDLKSVYPRIALECAVPCRTQPDRWPAHQQKRYEAILAACDKKTILQERYTPDCMEKRNRYMVDRADYLIAVWDGRPSGTGNTVAYARRQGKPTLCIHPQTLAMSRV